MTFTVAIIGRPNVGKSTLFNRLVGKRLALVHDTPGLTRDWRMADAELMGLKFKVIDTAGLEESFDDTIQGRMRQQTERALEKADFAFLVVDARTGLTPMDKHFAMWLRKQKIKSALLVNKCESNKAIEGMYEAYELGFGEPIPISAEHGQGMEDLYQLLRPMVEASAPPEPETTEEEDIERYFQKYQEGDETGFGDEEEVEDLDNPIKVAIVGRPNVGKSTFMNAILGEHRSMTGPEAGITRDAVHVDWHFRGRKMRLVDTAGMRKKARVHNIIEHMSVQDTLRQIRLAQVVILMVEADTEFEKQDLTIAHHVIDEGRALVVVANKWDAVEEKEKKLEELQFQLTKHMAQVKDVPLMTISALNGGKRVENVLQTVLDVYALWNKRVQTGKLNRWLRMMESQNPAPLIQGRQNRLRYMTQIKARPPTFALWMSNPDGYPEAHERYIVNGLRRDFDLPSVPVRIVLKQAKNPYKD